MKLFLILVAVMAAFFVSNAQAPASAQLACGQHTEVVTTLSKKYSEKPVSMGLGSNGAMIEVFASNKGTFTIVITRPNGNSCLVATGEGWKSITAKTEGFKS